MEEKYISGYCRQLDGPRTVEVILEKGEITEIDCCYFTCVHKGSCPIAAALAETE